MAPTAKIIKHLEKLKAVILALDLPRTSDEIGEIEKLIAEMRSKMGESDSYNSKEQRKTPKLKLNVFSENIKLICQQQVAQLTGTKLNYQAFPNSDHVIAYMQGKTKTKVLRETSLIDLKLLFFILTGETEELKGKKEDLYEVIKGNIRARNHGAAFHQLKDC